MLYFKMVDSRPLFYFRQFNTVDSQKMLADDWSRTVDLWCRKRPLGQLKHNHCLYKSCLWHWVGGRFKWFSVSLLLLRIVRFALKGASNMIFRRFRSLLFLLIQKWKWDALSVTKTHLTNFNKGVKDRLCRGIKVSFETINPITQDRLRFSWR